MLKDGHNVLFTGGVPHDSVEEVFRTLAGAVGGRALSLPDGEGGERRNWIQSLDKTVWARAKGIRRNADAPVAGEDSSFVPVAGPSLPSYFVDGDVDLRGLLAYSRAAIDSYAVFRRLRDDGVIPADTRFQVAIPNGHDAVTIYFPNVDDWPAAIAGWAAAVADECDRILDAIPAKDLAIQIDYCTELIHASGDLRETLPYIPEDDAAAVIDRYTTVDYLAPHVAGIDDDALLGYHLCLGTYPEYPCAKVRDIALPVAAANRIVENAGRRVDFLHLPSLSSSSREYFAPLADLRAGDAAVYLGVECNDGVDEMTRRMTAAGEFLAEFGVAHYCGYLWNKDIMPRLLADLNSGAEAVELAMSQRLPR